MFANKVLTRSGIIVEQTELNGYFIDFVRRGQDLVFTFENAEPTVHRSDGLRGAWSLGFLIRHGYSVIGVKPKAIDWYRGAAIHEWFRSPALADFIAGFHRVIFMGASMGGYAAITFSAVVPGSLVIAFNPQSSLHPRIAGWDGRFPLGVGQDWTGDFADAAQSVPLTKCIYIIYDPFDRLDLQHVKRLEHPHIIHLKTPFLGHSTAMWLNRMALLGPTTLGALNETLDSATFAKWMRKRRILPHYYVAASRRLTSAGRHAAAIAAASKAVSLQPDQKELRGVLDRARRVSRYG